MKLLARRPKKKSTHLKKTGQRGRLKSAIKIAAVSKLRELPPAELSQFTHHLGTIFITGLRNQQKRGFLNSAGLFPLLMN
jgi:hypothetical protein